MPGSNGLNLSKRLASETMRIPVIAISTQDDEETREQATELGTVCFYQKPIDPQALMDVVGWAIDKGEKRR
jgi:FixJ family two-component response regulator